MVMLNRGSSPVKDWYAVVQHPGFANFSTAYSVEFTPDLCGFATELTFLTAALG